ncbi:unnamed protein product [Brassica oleracea]
MITWRNTVLLVSSVERTLVPKNEYLERFPQYFSFSLERKIKPRHRLLKEHGSLMLLSEMLKVNDGQFNNLLLELRLRP